MEKRSVELELDDPDGFEDVLDPQPVIGFVAHPALSAPGEHILPVPPLELPPAQTAEPLDRLRQNEAIRLFVERADAASGAFELSAANRDYRVTAVTDGVATLWPDLQQACLTIWRRKFARLRTTEEVVAELAAW